MTGEAEQARAFDALGRRLHTLFVQRAPSGEMIAWPWAGPPDTLADLKRFRSVVGFGRVLTLTGCHGSLAHVSAHANDGSLDG